MPLPHLTLTLLPETLAVCRLAPDAPLPDWAVAGPFFAVTRTRDELSVVCRQEQIPDGVTCQPGWRCLQVAGPLNFSLTGVLASLALPLAQAGVSIFALSTYDTDYLLMSETALDAALAALRNAGHALA